MPEIKSMNKGLLIQPVSTAQKIIIKMSSLKCFFLLPLAAGNFCHAGGNERQPANTASHHSKPANINR
jgi:hypothetical protein